MERLAKRLSPYIGKELQALCRDSILIKNTLKSIESVEKDMTEIKNPPIELEPGEMYEAKYGGVVFTDDHTFADIIRWLISEGCDKEDAVYHYECEENPIV